MTIGPTIVHNNLDYIVKLVHLFLLKQALQNECEDQMNIDIPDPN